MEVMTQPLILNDILAQIHKFKTLGQKVLVVFDLDSTLFDVSGRNRRIVQEFASNPDMKSKYPRETLHLSKVDFHRTDWGIREPIVRSGLITESHEFFTDMRDFWRKNFFSNDFLHEDVPYDGAVEYVRELKTSGAHIMYLTGRDEIRMGKGTRQILRHWNFPHEEDGCQLVLKPHEGLDDAQFKADIFLQLSDDYASVWFFENEPVNIHLIAKQIPKVQIVYFDSTHSRKAEPPTHLPIIRDYVRRRR